MTRGRKPNMTPEARIQAAEALIQKQRESIARLRAEGSKVLNPIREKLEQVSEMLSGPKSVKLGLSTTTPAQSLQSRAFGHQLWIEQIEAEFNLKSAQASYFLSLRKALSEVMVKASEMVAQGYDEKEVTQYIRDGIKEAYSAGLDAANLIENLNRIVGQASEARESFHNAKKAGDCAQFQEMILEFSRDWNQSYSEGEEMESQAQA